MIVQGWTIRSKRTVLDQGKFLKVEYHEVELPDGTVIPDWAWVITPDFANIIAVTDEGKIICFRQTKYAVEGETLASVGGYIEAGEDPLVAAKRELLEETGYEADEWTFLTKCAVDANRGVGSAYSYLATGARKVTEADADDLEEQKLLLLSPDAVEDALLKGEFKAIGWSNSVALALLALKRRA
jgi:8-oxo-dGTP pyrophosphatase MutT (NUDIX family)